MRALKEIQPALQIYVRTTAPGWLFPEGVDYSRQSLDVGIVQQDSLAMDFERTVEECRSLLNDAPKLVAQELRFLRDHDVSLIVGDIPALAFEVAAQADIASVAVTNFTWTGIYQGYVQERPEFAPIIEEMAQFYSKATSVLALPYSFDLDVFPRKEVISWITRRSALDKMAAQEQFGLPHGATLVFLSFGGLGLERLPWERLKHLGEFSFVVTAAEKRRDGNIFVLPDTQHHYEDLLRAVDVLVTKPGYGIVADAISHRVPVLYTERGEFREYPYLVQALHDCATAEFIPQRELFGGNISPYLTRLLEKKPHWPPVELNGAHLAAEKLLALM
jgi:L-arabinokinase